MKKVLCIFIVILFFGGPLYVLLSGQLVLTQHWRTADRSSANIAPDPQKTKEAIVQIYAARAYHFRGMFAVHTWVAVKPKNAENYTVYQALFWNLFIKKTVLDVKSDIPDRIWFGHRPWMIYEKSGKEAEKIITEIQAAVKKYPYKSVYNPWPGPNSNTFTAYLIHQSPSLRARLPVTAIGKDYLVGHLCTKTLSKTGIQCSLKGVFGFSVAKVEGFEINILGFSFSINAQFPFLHVPGID